MRVLILAALLATPVWAEVPLTAEEFEADTTGKTITYAFGGEVDQIEQYLPGRRVRWANPEGQCMIGHWYEQGGLICFEYDDNSGAHCWTYWRRGSGLVGRVAGSPDGFDLTEVRRSTEPLACTGPDVGV
jgi:hypothetical protein